MWLIWIFIYLGQGGPLLPLTTGLIRYRRLDTTMRVLLLIPLAGAICEAAIRYFIIMKIPTNLPLLHYYTILEFLLIALFYQHLFRGFMNRWVFPAFSVLFLFYSLYNSLYVQPVTTYNSYALAVKSLFFIILAIIGFYRIMAEMKEERLLKNPEFWIHTGFLIYFASGLFIMILSNPVAALGKDFNYYVWGTRCLFIFLYYLSLTVGILVHK